MGQHPTARYKIQIEEGPARGDLYELEQATTFQVVDSTNGDVILTWRGEMSASLSKENAQWENFQYTGVSNVTISKDHKSVRVEFYDGTVKQILLPAAASPKQNASL